jgi:hypothetical protein
MAFFNKILTRPCLLPLNEGNATAHSAKKNEK